MRTEEPAAEKHRGADHPEHPPTLTIAEAAGVCGVSTSTIRRYLRAGRFPSARRAPSPAPGQPGQWRIPTQDLLDAGLDPGRPAPPGQVDDHQATGEPADAWEVRDRVAALEHALELERTRRQAAELLAAERARTISALEAALGALQHRGAGPAAQQPAAAAAAPSSSGAGRSPTSGPRPGVLRMVPRPERPRRDLSQEEKAAIIGRALARERLPKRRWQWW
jgi:transcriptional regulator with XRE-family HTH domain